MSTNYHTEIPSTGVAATAANINSPIGELDAAITQIVDGTISLDFLDLGTVDSNTISVGSITILKSYITVDTEASAVTDNLDTINGGSEGMLLFVRSVDATRVVTIRDSVGNVKNNGSQDVVLNDPEIIIAYLHNGTNFVSVNTVGSNTPTLEYADFDTTIAAPTHVTGRVWYDSSNKTLTVDMDGGVTRLQVGQENLFLGRNITGITIDNMTPVYINGATGNRPTIALAKADVEATSQLAGLATDDILNNVDGWVADIGRINDVDTTGTPYGEVWANGDIVYVSDTTAGDLTNVKPVAPNFVVQVGIVANSHATQGIIQLDIQWFGNLSNLADVNGTTPSDGDVLIWNNAGGYYDPDQQDHGNTTGLGDDDHTQYVLLAGRANNKIILPDSATTAPINWTPRSAAPSSPASGDMYMDDGTNTTSGNVGIMRYTGSVWEDLVAGTVVKIGSVEVTGSVAASISFSAIPATFTSLRLEYRARSDGGTTIRVNMGATTVDSGANYYSQHWYASGTARTAGEALASTFMSLAKAAVGPGAVANLYGGGNLYFYDYAASRKTSLNMLAGSSSAATTGETYIATAWAYHSQNTIIDIITISPATNNWEIGSKFELYGVV